MYIIDKEDSVNKSVDIMTSNLHTILDKHAPWKHKRVRNCIQPIWFNSE